jgi:UDP-N-acetylmuramate dehydrogenase
MTPLALPAAIPAVAFALLSAALGAQRLKRRVPLGPLTTFKIGGPADLLYEAENADDLAKAVTAARESGLPWFLLGLGANILVGDGGFRGLVIHNRARRISVFPTSGRITAESGAVVYPPLIESAVVNGLSGLEHYAGIPSTVGGALWQNLHFLSPAPARERTVFIAEVIEGAEILTEEGVRKKVDVGYFDFGYDRSILHQRRDVVLTATFHLRPSDPQNLRRIIGENLTWRAARHPPLDTEPSAGSIFKKVDGVGAGRLIEESGLKGLRIGGAEVTQRHANIVVNRGGATAADVRAVIARVQEVVEAKTGHRLEPEISFVGEP